MRSSNHPRCTAQDDGPIPGPTMRVRSKSPPAKAGGFARPGLTGGQSARVYGRASGAVATVPDIEARMEVRVEGVAAPDALEEGLAGTVGLGNMPAAIA